ncbi:MAG: DUF547 domain-containing protein [Phycisphaerales bacterium]|nr:MAG: DUF547 domain-containing protein [Phycisphaerales bacterium]
MNTHLSRPANFGVLVLAVIFWAALSMCSEGLAADKKAEDFSFDNYAAVLKDYVDAGGMVNYKKLKADRSRLDAFVKAMAELDPKTFERWSESQKIAFWLNAYNGLTLKAIIDNYPIKSSFFRSRVYPKNSIRQISGVWDKKYRVMGRDISLDEIEHKVLREKFDEPGIHMALVCAAMSCPPLRNEPYLTAKLDTQLKDQTEKFLSDPKKFRIGSKNKIIYLSPIFKWFGDDFVGKYGAGSRIGRFSKKVSAVLNFVSKHIDADWGAPGGIDKYAISYLSYDWSLNEQPAPKGRGRSGR